MSKPITLTEQKLFDYIACPCKYDLKYNRRIVIDDDSTVNIILKQVSKYFYMYLINNLRTPTLNTLTNKYESLYKEKVDVIESSQYNKGLLLLRNFYNWACSSNLAVIEPDAKYVISHKGIILEGIMNPIAINKDKQLEFLIVNFSNKSSDQFMLDSRMKYTLDTMAFNDSNKEYKIFATKVHDAKSGKDFITSRNQTDYDRFLSTLENVAKGIENKIFYPRESPMCTSCSYKNICRGWKKEDQQ